MSYSTSTTTTTSSDNTPFMASDIDLSKIMINDPVPGKANPTFKSGYITYNGQPLMVQTPWLRTWDGIVQPSEQFRQPGAPPKYSLNFSLNGKNKEQVMLFQQFLNDFDNKIIEEACKEQNAKTWGFNKKMSPEICEHIYSKQLKLAKDKETNDFTDKYPANFRVKVPFYEGVWKDVELYNENMEEVIGDLSMHLTGRCDVRAILKCSTIWFAGSKFGITWQLHKAEYKADEQLLKSYRFRPENEG